MGQREVLEVLDANPGKGFFVKELAQILDCSDIIVMRACNRIVRCRGYGCTLEQSVTGRYIAKYMRIKK